ncbi:3-hydroxyacyl-ACP dehydratase FabZ family protein [Salegentibacter sp. F188]|uniref:3-hydroxyacyl-ACP dehydratase FabZ family protein n=1 Tax=Autumnicola patrickiae TaxID=3075591 RepID=A0ABU3E2K6_9FLAO|nr:3-hydroxyacyl-ACP dehydratase FabZ family protein [Salegentibacter sp. F188]MDT0690165.1 3-hydroxyacyl-ACP dehydratase FabZ family protein [Salegentibacter sp. F188]
MDVKKILSQLPYSDPFLFVDNITQVDENCLFGYYTFPPESFFYKGHFKDNPVTPGVILTECMAQIGLVCFGIFLLNKEHSEAKNHQIALSSSEVEFFKPVFPGETVKVASQKKYFRFNKLKCDVEMFNAEDELVCKGTIAGMMKVSSE